MAVSSLKGCWTKLSARIRDYIEVVDSYYRADEVDAGVTSTNGNAGDVAHHHGHFDYKSSLTTSKDKGRSNQKTTHRHHGHHTANELDRALRIASQQATSPRLPAGYTKRKTAQGQVYFVDSNGHKYWHDPSVPKELLNAKLDLDNLVGRLSNNWEISRTSSGKTYFINHIKKTTQFTDPRLIACKDELMSYLRLHLYETIRDPTDHSSLLARHGFSERSTDMPTLPRSHTSSNSNREFSATNHQQTSSQRRNSAFAQGNGNCHRVPTSRENSRIAMRPIPQIDNSSRNYQRNLLRGSHQNLSSSMTSAGRSNTLTGPPPGWLKPTLSGLRKHVANTSNHPSASRSTMTTTATNNQLSPSATLNSSSLHNSSNHSNHHHYHSINNNRTVTEPSFCSSQLPPFSPYEQTHPDSKNKELFDKISILRQELVKQQVLSHPCRIDINRKRIFEESFRIISQMQPRDLKKRLLVKFRGEEGLDYGGVAREWFYLLSREILNPVHGLFQYTSDDIYNLQINPDSGIVYREHLSYFNFCGRVIGMAVFHGHFIEGHFTLPFYKMLLQKPISLSDIEFVDPELHRSLCWILENDITNIIDTTFLVQHNAFGQLQEHELKDNGRDIVVTEENKHEYVSLYVNYRCRRGIDNQFEALQRGFYELILPSLVKNFDEHELELLIGGLSKIDIDDWRIHTKLKNCTVETPLVLWFWDIVKSYDEDKRARLLQFVTGSPRVPIQGFKALQGVNSELRLFTIHLIRNANTDNLPKSHTCFNRIDLPPYETYDKLRDKLTQAIEETMGFAMQ